jgi:type VI protein secretion system component Hcp
MIIARICGPKGQLLFHGSVEIEGSPAGDDYRQGGWFPVESFNFGFEGAPSDDSKKDGQPTPNTPGARGSTGHAGSNASNRSNAPSQSDKDKGDLQEISISKEVDRATTDLMVLAMEERSKAKSANRASGGKELCADIHVLGSVIFKDSVMRNAFASLMIHLECVAVKEWGISGSGDNRPSETVKLKFDKAAMHYTWYDGSQFLYFGPKGWDQKNHAPWDAAETAPAFEKYKPKFGRQC